MIQKNDKLKKKSNINRLPQWYQHFVPLRSHENSHIAYSWWQIHQSLLWWSQLPCDMQRSTCGGLSLICGMPFLSYRWAFCKTRVRYFYTWNFSLNEWHFPGLAFLYCLRYADAHLPLELLVACISACCKCGMLERGCVLANAVCGCVRKCRDKQPFTCLKLKEQMFKYNFILISLKFVCEYKLDCFYFCLHGLKLLDNTSICFRCLVN